MKKLLIFLAGIFTGVVGWKLYKYICKGQVKTFDTMDEFTKSLAYDFTEDDYREWAKIELTGLDKLFTPDELASLEDTQPIYIGPDKEAGTHELDAWSRESE